MNQAVEVDFWQELTKWPRGLRLFLALVASLIIAYAAVFGLTAILGFFRGSLFDPICIAVFLSAGVIQNGIAWWKDQSLWKIPLLFGIFWGLCWFVVAASISKVSWETFIVPPIPILFSVSSARLLRYFAEQAGLRSHPDSAFPRKAPDA